jgi:hypothetical protein
LLNPKLPGKKIFGQFKQNFPQIQTTHSFASIIDWKSLSVPFGTLSGVIISFANSSIAISMISK